MMGKAKRIAIFGGSFDPPHRGHIAICNYLFNQNHVDEIIIIPCYLHPFGKKLISFEHRFKMCQLGFGKLLLPIIISDIEKQLGNTSHTVRTLRHLKKQYTSHRLFLIRGLDVRHEEEQWQDMDQIKSMVDIIDIHRGENSTIPNISSSQIRENIHAQKSFAPSVEKEVAVYITLKGLYC